MSKGSVTIDLGQGAPIIIETGEIALLANGAVTVSQGETKVLVTACSGGVREGMDFFPLQVSYREKFSAAGRMPGGYLKREGRPTDKEVLTGRMIDRPIRPLFEKGFYNEVQVQCHVMSADDVHAPDALGMLGASAALMLSDLPFQGPLGSMRVALIDGEFVVNPSYEQQEKSNMELIYSGLVDKTIMIEGDSDEISEETLFEGIKFANEKAKIMIAAQIELAEKFGKATVERTISRVAEDAIAAVKAQLTPELIDAPCLVIDRTERGAALNEVFEKISPAAEEGFDAERVGELKDAFNYLVEMNIRRLILEEGKRSDGRGAEDMRALHSEVSVLARTHGSALFSRGETQTVVSTTLGSSDAAKKSDDPITGTSVQNFYLHYNFPNYSVGECGRIMGPGNREIGHGNLAERSVAKMMPEDYSYVVRVVSDVMGSNGSTSMASICGASLALLDAGVPLKKHVAGISVGLVTDSEDPSKYVMITDILGSEDHYGDMDFKVAGTRDGITGFQLDLKIAGIPLDMMYEAMLKDKTARMAILDNMEACINAPREEASPYAPRIHNMKINPEKIGALIGPGGKNIKGICEETDCKIDIEEDGTVKVFSQNRQSLDAAIEKIEELTSELEIGKIYRGVVDGVKEFGAFVVIMGQSGLLHISEMADYRVEDISEICSVGDKITVKVLDIDNRGRIKLSRKAALEEMND